MPRRDDRRGFCQAYKSQKVIKTFTICHMNGIIHTLYIKTDDFVGRLEWMQHV